MKMVSVISKQHEAIRGAKLNYGDEFGIVLFELHLTRKVELRDGDEVNDVLVELCLTQNAELCNEDEASIVPVEFRELKRPSSMAETKLVLSLLCSIEFGRWSSHDLGLSGMEKNGQHLLFSL